MEEEEPLEFKNTQVRYSNGYRVTESEIHGCDDDGLYCNDFAIEMPPPTRQAIGCVWTPDQHTAYSLDHVWHQRPLSGRTR